MTGSLFVRLYGNTVKWEWFDVMMHEWLEQRGVHILVLCNYKHLLMDHLPVRSEIELVADGTEVSLLMLQDALNSSSLLL